MAPFAQPPPVSSSTDARPPRPTARPSPPHAVRVARLRCFADAPPRPAPALPRRIVFLDLETTGLSPRHDRILEVGWVLEEGGQVLDEDSTLARYVGRLDPVVARMLGAASAQLASAPPLSRALATLRLALFDVDAIVAHNARFDLAFLAAAGLCPSAPVYDSLRLARQAWPALRSHRLASLRAHLDLPHRRAHRALDDAFDCRDVFWAATRAGAPLAAGLVPPVRD